MSPIFRPIHVGSRASPNKRTSRGVELRITGLDFVDPAEALVDDEDADEFVEDAASGVQSGG